MDNIDMKKTNVTPEKILEIVEKQLELPSLKTKKRTRELVQGRLIYYKLAKTFCRYASLARIGRAAERDHSTVVYGLNKYDIESKFDPYMRDIYDHLYNKLDPMYNKQGQSANVDMTFERILERLNKIENKLNITV